MAIKIWCKVVYVRYPGGSGVHVGGGGVGGMGGGAREGGAGITVETKPKQTKQKRFGRFCFFPPSVLFISFVRIWKVGGEPILHACHGDMCAKQQ